jgi:large subunit ribosomal protein L19e
LELSVQRKLAAEILGVGVHRIWIDPTRATDVSAAISREDIRRLIKRGIIKAKPEKAISRGRFRERVSRRGKRRGMGSRKGTKKARQPKKAAWIRIVRPLRSRLRELKQEGLVDKREYRKLYRMIKGGAFESKAHLEMFLRERKRLKG